MSPQQTIRYWLSGIRFYIALASLLVSGGVIWWARTAYGGTILYPTRIEETFAWLAVGLLGLAVAIGPAYKLLPSLPGRQLLFDARRLIGISAAWFASLHAGIAFGTLFKFPNPLELPTEYKQAFLLGAVGLITLLAMAFTSFDKAFHGMGIWWFRLHRLVYVAVIVTLFHAFQIGVHATQLLPLVLVSLTSAVILGMYVYTKLYRGTPSRWQTLTILTMTVLLVLGVTYGFSQHHNAAIVTQTAASGG